VPTQLDFASPLPLTQKNTNLEQILFLQLLASSPILHNTKPTSTPFLSTCLTRKLYTTPNTIWLQKCIHTSTMVVANLLCHQHNSLMKKVPHTKYISYFWPKGAICIPKVIP